MKPLMRDAVDAFRTGLTAPDPIAGIAALGRELEKAGQKFLAEQVPAAEVATLARLGRTRETALRLARENRLEEAETVMSQVRSERKLPKFSPTAAACEWTQYQAAESYLSYRRSDYPDAFTRMRDAMRATEALEEILGPSQTISGRQVHLAHNLVRVYSRSGDTAAAVRLCSRLLAWIGGITDGWPVQECGRPPAERFEPIVGEYWCNTLAATIAELSADPDGDGARQALSAIPELRNAPQPPAPRVWNWLRLKEVARAERTGAFLRGAGGFLRAGYGRTPTLWYAVALDLLFACGARRTDAAVSAATREIGHGLMEAKVPAAIRLIAEARMAAWGFARAVEA